MKAIKFLSLSLLATMIASCSSEEVALTNKEATATLTGNIGSSLMTRAYDNMWEADDKIGVFIYENKKDEEGNAIQEIFEGYDGSQFIRKTDEVANTQEFVPASSAVIKYPSNNNKLSFHAYWPWTDGISTTSPYFTPDWADQSDPKKLDLLVSDTQTGDKDHQSVTLTFKHKFARIILNIDANTKESQIQYKDLENLKIIAAKMSADVEYDVVNDICKKEVNTEEIVFNTNKDGLYSSAIICPGVNDGDTARVVTFTLKNGKKFIWKIDPTQKFEEGNSYSWKITLKGQELVGATLIGTIINWGDGAIVGDKEFDLEEAPESNGGNTEGGSGDNSGDGSDDNSDDGSGDNSNEDTGEGSTDGPESNS